jgi:hypothetical protein
MGEITDTIVINVGGVRHEILQTTLQKMPTSRLARLNEQSVNYRKSLNEYYFDRHPGIFATILNVYRTDELHVPQDVCGPAFKLELDFWHLEEHQIQECCWIRYNEDANAKHTLKKLTDKYRQDNEQIFLSESEGCCTRSSWQGVRRAVWQFLDYPLSSRGAKVS